VLKRNHGFDCGNDHGEKEDVRGQVDCMSDYGMSSFFVESETAIAKKDFVTKLSWKGLENVSLLQAY